MKTIIQFRAGAPDKVNMFTSGTYNLVKKDGVNLTDYTELELLSDSEDTLYLSSSEDDIKYANSLPESVQKRVILPKMIDGRVIPYNLFVPKNSEFYKRFTESTGILYPKFKEYDPDAFLADWLNITMGRTKYVLKVSIGSGSRGVYVIDNQYKHCHGTREHYNDLTQTMVNDLVDLAKKTQCKILMQDLAYTSDIPLDKFDVDLMIRNGKLVAYKWSLPDNPSTNWDHGYFLRNEYTEAVINRIANYLISCGIYDGMVGFDGYTNYQDYCTIIEVNFRQQNCFFMFEAFGIDFIEMWLNPDQDWMAKIPFGKHAHVRYWRCMLSDLKKGK